MAIIFITIISFLISFTWLHYFKKIDLFENEKFIHILAVFLVGTIFPFSIYLIHDYAYNPVGISDSEYPLYSFLYYVFGVGLLEEIIKFVPVLIIIYFFKKSINEPLDYVKYICVSALGFAFGENIEYALNYGGHVLLSRSILAVPAHMFFSAIFIYGIIEYKYDSKKPIIIVKYILLAALAHGIYDFLLVYDLPFIGAFIHILFFMILINVFVNILNNCLNLSPFYSPKKAIDQQLIRKYLITYYFLITFLILVFATLNEGIGVALKSYLWLVVWESSILIVLIVRLSRFSIIPNYKNKLGLQMPFYFNSQPSAKDHHFFFGIFTIRGESYNEHRITKLFDETIKVIPLSLKRSYLNQIFDGVIEKKVYENKTLYFLVKIYFEPTKRTSKYYVLMPKTEGLTHNADGDPIVSLNAINYDKSSKLEFLEWVLIKKHK